MVVMKFGGTSVEDAKAIRGVSAIVKRYLARRPIVVSSACSGVTNALLSIARAALSGGSGKAQEQVEQIRLRHRKIAHDLFTGDVLFTVQSQIDALVDELRDIARSISILGELTLRSLDTFASFGERLSTLLLYYHFVQEGMESVLINAQEVIVTNNDFTKAVPDFAAIDARVAAIVKPRLEAGQVVVTQGFLGATPEGVPTTIGRGGSDYSAAILGAALDAEEIQIWTDVDGIMTCDPRTISEAQPIPDMTFREAAELAYFGAKVLHPATILPAVQKDIPVRVLNSKHPEGEGTVILRTPSGGDRRAVKAIAFKEDITLINIASTRMLMMHGFLAKVFEVFARYEQSVDVIATSEVSLSLTLDKATQLDKIREELSVIADVEILPGKAIFCVVGEQLQRERGIIARMLDVLDTQAIDVRMISFGASEINVTFVVDSKDIRATAQALHDEFFG